MTITTEDSKVVSFERNENIVVAVRLTKKGPKTVAFEIVSATDFPESAESIETDIFEYKESEYFMYLDSSGNFVDSFDDALFLARGRYMVSDNPDYKNSLNYLILMHENTIFRNEFEGLYSIINNEALKKAKILLDEY